MGNGKGEGGTCSGDSGGPVFYGGYESNIIVAVTSFGLNALCRGTDFAFRTDQQVVIDWILETVESLRNAVRRHPVRDALTPRPNRSQHDIRDRDPRPPRHARRRRRRRLRRRELAGREGAEDPPGTDCSAHRRSTATVRNTGSFPPTCSIGIRSVSRPADHVLKPILGGDLLEQGGIVTTPTRTSASRHHDPLPLAHGHPSIASTNTGTDSNKNAGSMALPKPGNNRGLPTCTSPEHFRQSRAGPTSPIIPGLGGDPPLPPKCRMVSPSRRWRAAQVGGEAERYGARNRGGRLPAASREHRSMWPSSSRSGTSGCLSGDGARRPVCSADCYRAAVGEKGGGPRMVIPRGFAVADAWRRARSTRSAVSSVAGSLAPR